MQARPSGATSGLNENIVLRKALQRAVEELVLTAQDAARATVTKAASVELNAISCIGCGDVGGSVRTLHHVFSSLDCFSESPEVEQE